MSHCSEIIGQVSWLHVIREGMNPYRLFKPLACLAFALCLTAYTADVDLKRPPNFIIIFADDLGYGDLSSYGHPSIRTPHLDRMGAEGVRLTDFYSAASVCTPSRAALLTGRYPIRSGMCSSSRRVLFPDSALGLPAEEWTLAEILKTVGYTTACVGKWHLGHLPQYLPTSNGFDSYFGIPYSNDMDRVPGAGNGRSIFWEPKSEYWNVPLMQNENIIERPADQTTITRRYSEAAVDFIRRSSDKPFFLYLAHSLPHVPLFASQSFSGTSSRGLYGDVIEEIDHGVGQIMAALEEEGLSQNTFLFFTSDNGPWLPFKDHGGSAGLLREGKGCTWEGGMRVPAVARFPGVLPGGSINSSMATTMDLLPTLAKLAGAEIPENVMLDGKDILPMLQGQDWSPHESFIYYRGAEIFAVRFGQYKAHFKTRSGYRDREATPHNPPLLYHLGRDPGELYDIAKDHPEILKTIDRIVEEHKNNLVPRESQLEKRL